MMCCQREEEKRKVKKSEGMSHEDSEGKGEPNSTSSTEEGKADKRESRLVVDLNPLTKTSLHR